MSGCQIIRNKQIIKLNQGLLQLTTKLAGLEMEFWGLNKTEKEEDK